MHRNHRRSEKRSHHQPAFTGKEVGTSLHLPDEELDEWKKHLSEFPNEWINGYDKKFTIKEEQVYDLKAIPTLYLLDKDKTVLLKDATAPAIEAYLMQHQ